MKHRTLALALIVILALIFSACAPAAAPSPTAAPKPVAPAAPTAPAPTAAPAAAAATAPAAAAEPNWSGKTVKIGVVNDITGPIQDYGQKIAKGLDMAVEELNAKGGIYGAKVELVKEDPASDRAQASALIRKLAGDKDIAGIVGPISTSAVVPAAEVCAQLGIICVATGSSTIFAPGTLGEWVFRTALIGDKPFPEFLKQTKAKLNYTTIGIVYTIDNDYSVFEQDFLKSNAEKYGLKVLGIESARMRDNDFSAQLTSLMAKNPDVLWPAAPTNEAALIIQQARQRGFKGPVLGGATLNEPAIYKLSGGAAEGFLTYFPFNPFEDRPLVKAFTQKYTERYKEQVPVFVAYGYDATNNLIAAIKRAKSTDRKAVRDAFAATKDQEGLAGKYAYTAGSDNQTSSFYIFEMKGGEFQPWKK